MNLNINEKKVLYVFGCPSHMATIKRLCLLSAIAPDPAVKKLFCNLSRKLDLENAGQWYRCFFYTLHHEMAGYFHAERKIRLVENSTYEVEDGYGEVDEV